jgi:hypothetical protein
LAVSYHKCKDSVGEFMEAECNPCDPVSGKNFLADIVFKMSSLIIVILMSIVSLGNIEVMGHFSEVAILVLSKLHWGIHGYRM